MPQCFETDFDYEIINDGTDLLIDIEFLTPNQSPDFTLRVDGVEKIQNGNKSVYNYVMKTDKELNGKVVKLFGNIADTPNNTNEITLTVVVKGGVAPEQKDFKTTVSAGETVEIDIIIRPFA